MDERHGANSSRLESGRRLPDDLASYLAKVHALEADPTNVFDDRSLFNSPHSNEVTIVTQAKLPQHLARLVVSHFDEFPELIDEVNTLEKVLAVYNAAREVDHQPLTKLTYDLLLEAERLRQQGGSRNGQPGEFENPEEA